MVSLVLTTLFLLAVTVSQVFATNPGLQMKITQNGLNYANTVAQAALAQGLQSLRIPDQSGSSGHISWSLSNIQNKGVTVPTSSINLNPGLNGLTWSLSNLGINLKADWRVKYKQGWVKISDSGSVDLSVSQISLSVTIGIGADQASRPSISTKSCSANIGHVSIDFHGGTAFIWNLFKGPLEDKVRGLLLGQICTVVTNKINVDGEAALAKMKVSVEIDHRFLLDYGLLEPVTFTADYLQSRHRGEVYWKDDKRESPFSPDPIPYLSDVSNMLYLWLTEYTAKTFAYTAQQHGFLTYNLTQKDLPPDTLNTSCNLPKCIGFLIPQLRTLYPNSSVEIRINSNQTPQLTLATSGLTLMLFADLTLYAHTSNGSIPYLLTLNMSLSLTGQISIANEKVVGNITNYSIKIGVIKSAIGDVSATSLNFVLNVALKTFVIPKFNEMAQTGFALPLSGDIKLKNSKLTLLNGVLLISTDLQYKSLVEDSLMFIPEIQVS